LPSDLRIRRVEDDDLPALVEHFQLAFERWPWVETPATPLEHLRWKTEAGPGPPEHFVAELDGRIVAVKLHHVWTARVRGRELRTLRGYDSSVHPEYQARGLMGEAREKILKRIKPRIDLMMGGSNNPAMATILHQGERISFAQRWSVLSRPAGEAEDPARPWTVRTAERFDERTDGFCREASAPFDFIMVRSRPMLNWRYDRRAGAFTIRLAEQDGRLLGYAVLRAQRGAGYIADLLALPERPDIVESLARDAARELRERAVERVECWLLPDHPYAEALRRCGYLERDRRRPPTIEPVGVPASEVAFLAGAGVAVHFTLGDIDFV
jgi:hypothetical protein